MGDHTTGLRTNHGGHVGWVHQCCWWCVPQQHGLHQAQGKDLAQLLQLLLDAKGGLHLQTGKLQVLLIKLDLAWCSSALGGKMGPMSVMLGPIQSHSHQTNPGHQW